MNNDVNLKQGERDELARLMQEFEAKNSVTKIEDANAHRIYTVLKGEQSRHGYKLLLETQQGHALAVSMPRAKLKEYSPQPGDEVYVNGIDTVAIQTNTNRGRIIYNGERYNISHQVYGQIQPVNTSAPEQQFEILPE